MPIVKTSVLINAPAEKIFDTMVDPVRIPKWSPMNSVSNIKGNPGEIGSSADYFLIMFGVKLKQTMTVLEVDKPNKIIYEMAGGFPGKWTYTLKTQDYGVRVSADVYYTVRWGCNWQNSEQDSFTVGAPEENRTVWQGTEGFLRVMNSNIWYQDHLQCYTAVRVKGSGNTITQ